MRKSNQEVTRSNGSNKDADTGPLIRRMESKKEEFPDMIVRHDDEISEIDGLRDRIGNIEAAAHTSQFETPVGNSKINLGRFLRTRNPEDLGPQMSLSIGTDGDGGYTHIPELGKEIIAAVAELNPLMREVDKVTIESNIFDQIFTTTRSASARSAESGSRSESSTATFVKTSVTLYDLYSYPKITNELLYSSQFDLDKWIRNEITEAFSEALSTEFITGDGSSKSVGLLNAMSANTLSTSPQLAWGSVHFESGAGSPEAITYATLLNTISSLHARYRAAGNCKWFMSTSAIEAVRNLLDQNNLPIWRQDFGVAGQPMVLMGFPVVEVPALDNQTYRVLFGDMRKAYAFVSHKRGLGILIDNVTSVGFTKFYGSLQCAGGTMDSRAIVALRAV
ncbi:phage major capsid protein [Gammaproteobacteria bacterium]|nr:phage major capsid protein [Gammaproteobacteria bacterium]